MNCSLEYSSLKYCLGITIFTCGGQKRSSKISRS